MTVKLVCDNIKIISIQKFRSGEHIFSGSNATYQFMMPLEAWDEIFGKMDAEAVGEITKSILDNLETLKKY